MNNKGLTLVELMMLILLIFGLIITILLMILGIIALWP